jgi:hypothetical protein
VSFTEPFLAVTVAGNAAAFGDAEAVAELEADADEGGGVGEAGVDFDDEHPAASNAEPAMKPTATRRDALCRRECTRSAPPADPRPAPRTPIQVT